MTTDVKFKLATTVLASFCKASPCADKLLPMNQPSVADKHNLLPEQSASVLASCSPSHVLARTVCCRHNRHLTRLKVPPLNFILRRPPYPPNVSHGSGCFFFYRDGYAEKVSHKSIVTVPGAEFWRNGRRIFSCIGMSTLSR